MLLQQQLSIEDNSLSVIAECIQGFEETSLEEMDGRICIHVISEIGVTRRREGVREREEEGVVRKNDRACIEEVREGRRGWSDEVDRNETFSGIRIEQA